jgi:uncharacterized protein YbbC (DUF1343 family)
MLKLFAFMALLAISLSCRGTAPAKLKTGAEQPEKYLHLLQGNVGLVVNHTSIAGEVHLIDFLLQQGVKVTKILTPEHGFRGDALEGELVKDGLDKKTGIPVISLYSSSRKPAPAHLQDLDVLVFDIQDVGARFYTYISTMHLVMEACAENNKPLIVLDRPNPNGDYIAGPVLQDKYKSFVGMHPIPVVHGCTVGELAMMINGENWLNNNLKCKLTVIPVMHYTHSMRYTLPVPPSPNLPNELAVRLYPSLCFFEATSISVGRGTEFPFQVLGGTKPELGDFTFIPKAPPEAAIRPLHEGKICYGVDLRQLEKIPPFTLRFFLDFYNKFDNEKEFLTRENWLNTLAGSNKLINQIRQGLSETEIINSWQPELDKYKLMRKKYLLYPDFE